MKGFFLSESWKYTGAENTLFMEKLDTLDYFGDKYVLCTASCCFHKVWHKGSNTSHLKYTTVYFKKNYIATN